MKEADVIIVPLPQSDGMVKNRPAVILREMPPFQDPLVCWAKHTIAASDEGF